MESGPNTIQPVSPEGPAPDTRPAPNTETLPGVQGNTMEDKKPLSLVGTPQIVSDMSMNILYSENIDGMRERVSVIDMYIKNEMGARDMDATVGSYRKVLADVKARLNISEETGAMNSTSLLYYYLKGKMNL